MEEKAENKYTLGRLLFTSLCRIYSTAVRIEEKKAAIKKKKNKYQAKNKT